MLQREDEVVMYYRTEDMQEPVLEFAVGQSGKYAVRATVVPTFDDKKDFFEVVWGKKPPAQNQFLRGIGAKNFHIIFILDLRSAKA